MAPRSANDELRARWHAAESSAIAARARPRADRVRRGIVSIPHGWGSRVFSPADGADPIVHGVNRNLLVDHRVVDPFSGTPNLNSTRVAVERIA